MMELTEKIIRDESIFDRHEPFYKKLKKSPTYPKGRYVMMKWTTELLKMILGALLILATFYIFLILFLPLEP